MSQNGRTPLVLTLLNILTKVIRNSWGITAGFIWNLIVWYILSVLWFSESLLSRGGYRYLMLFPIRIVLLVGVLGLVVVLVGGGGVVVHSIDGNLTASLTTSLLVTLLLISGMRKQQEIKKSYQTDIIQRLGNQIKDSSYDICSSLLVAFIVVTLHRAPSMGFAMKKITSEHFAFKETTVFRESKREATNAFIIPLSSPFIGVSFLLAVRVSVVLDFIKQQLSEYRPSYFPLLKISVSCAVDSVVDWGFIIISFLLLILSEPHYFLKHLMAIYSARATDRRQVSSLSISHSVRVFPEIIAAVIVLVTLIRLPGMVQSCYKHGWHRSQIFRARRIARQQLFLFFMDVVTLVSIIPVVLTLYRFVILKILSSSSSKSGRSKQRK